MDDARHVRCSRGGRVYLTAVLKDGAAFFYLSEGRGAGLVNYWFARSGIVACQTRVADKVTIELTRKTLRSMQAVAVHLVVQSSDADAEGFGGVFTVAVAGGESGLDGILFGSFCGIRQWAYATGVRA